MSGIYIMWLLGASGVSQINSLPNKDSKPQTQAFVNNYLLKDLEGLIRSQVERVTRIAPHRAA
jgi:hypothetical protein